MSILYTLKILSIDLLVCNYYSECIICFLISECFYSKVVHKRQRFRLASSILNFVCPRSRLYGVTDSCSTYTREVYSPVTAMAASRCCSSTPAAFWKAATVSGYSAGRGPTFSRPPPPPSWRTWPSARYTGEFTRSPSTATYLPNDTSSTASSTSARPSAARLVMSGWIAYPHCLYMVSSHKGLSQKGMLPYPTVPGTNHTRIPTGLYPPPQDHSPNGIFQNLYTIPSLKKMV